MITLNDASRDAAADGLLAGLAGQTCHLYGGAVPADASESAGPPIATGTTGSWGAHAGDSGAALAAPFTLTGTAAAGTGTVATYFRLLGAGGEVLQGLIGPDLVANNPLVTEGQLLRVTGLVVILPEAGAQGGAGLGVLPGILGSGTGSAAILGAGSGLLPSLVGEGVGGAPSGANWDLTQRLPAGLTLRSSPPFQSKTGEGWFEADGGSGSPQTIVSAATPTGDNSLLRQSFAGVADGDGPYRMFTGMTGTPNRIFWATVTRLGASFMQVPNELKWFTWANDPGNGWLGMYQPGVFLGDPEGADGSMILRMFHRPGGSEDNDLWSRIDLHGAANPIPVGPWFKLSLDFTIAPARVVCWIDYADGSGGLHFDTDDGVYQGSLSDPLTTMTWAPGAARIVELLLASVWGGGNGGPGTANEYFDYDASVVYTD